MKYEVGFVFKKSFEITDEMVVGFAQVSQDRNPVHLDQEYASNTIFKNRIAHGMLLGGLISSILGNDFPGNGTIYLNQNLSFKKPVFLDAIVDFVVEIIEINPKGWLTLQTNCFTDGVMVIEGTALVIPPKYNDYGKYENTQTIL